MYKTKKRKKELRQWHPVFYAGLQVELEEDAENIIFENEHQLGTGPKEIDILIINKNKDQVIHKNIGQIFKGHNIIEYKSPPDYLSVDDFYKVYGYACFYKSDTKAVDEIKSRDITITFVCHRYPRKLIRHLEKFRRYKISERERGIYDITGDEIPMQLIMTSELDKEKNIWLSSISNPIESAEEAERLIELYDKKKNNRLYEDVMEWIITENREKFMEVNGMCNALREVVEEIMKDKIIAREEKIRQESKVEGIMALIMDNAEAGISEEKISIKLQKYFRITPEEAAEHIKNCHIA